MKKTLFGLMTIVMMAVVCVGFSACGGDDEGDGGSSSGLTGVWKRVYKKTTYYVKDSNGEWVQSGQPSETTYKGSYSGFQFMSGNRAQEIDIDANGNITPDGDAFEYKVENGKLYMLELDHPEDGWEDFGTINISGNTFELTSEDQKSSSSRKEVKLKRYRKM
jgi:hypothetical protein